MMNQDAFYRQSAPLHFFWQVIKRLFLNKRSDINVFLFIRVNFFHSNKLFTNAVDNSVGRMSK